ncbi:GspH/FimT family pseudopilin [Ramlibacter sp. AN1133]|uniref:GspH/FimT family pseudopilin n=1 Tax=Ramlibacter sp. AN1133 TaxID=3133429 RepID=UPI0030BC1B53
MDRPARGFTLVEVLVTVSVLGVLLAVGVPSFAELLDDLRLQTVSNDVLQQLMLARSEAIKRNARVVVCKSADGEACAETGGWEQGWIVFHDANNSGTREPGEPVIQGLRGLPPGWRLVGNGPVTHYVSYGPVGVTRLVSGAFQAGSFTVCRASVDAVQARRIIINAAGRPRVQKVRLDSCS